MYRHQLILFLAILVGMSSCDMSRWYFRHGGKSHESEYKSEHRQSTSTLETDAGQTVRVDTLKPLTFDTHQFTAESKQSAAAPINMEPQAKSFSATIGCESVKKESKQLFSKRTPSDSGMSRTSGASLAAFIILLIVLVFIIWGLFIFLISWIFVAAAVALRIALWGLLITIGLSLLISITLTIVDHFS